MFDKIRALLAHRCCQPLRWKTTLCTVSNLEYNTYMTFSRDYTSSSITFFNFAQENDVTSSPPCLFIRNSLAICSFSAIKKWTLELVDSAYALVASANATRCLHTSHMIMITHSSNYAGDVLSSEVDTPHDCTTLYCDSLNHILSISPSGLSLRISVSPWSLGTFSAYESDEVCGSTSWW